MNRIPGIVGKVVAGVVVLALCCSSSTDEAGIAHTIRILPLIAVIAAIIGGAAWLVTWCIVGDILYHARLLYGVEECARNTRRYDEEA